MNPSVDHIEATQPDGALLAYELTAVLTDGTRVFIGAIYETDIDFDHAVFTIDGRDYRVELGPTASDSETGEQR